MNGHRRLPVWQQAKALVKTIYELTRSLPREELHVASAQVRRAAWSIAANIAEGNAKLGKAEMRRYFDIALGSLAEVDSIVGILPGVYPAIEGHLGKVEELRRAITQGIFGILRRRGR